MPGKNSQSDGAAAAYAKFLQLACGIERTPRTGWQLRGLDNVEPVACHMWAMACTAASLLCELGVSDNVDVDRVIALCLVHDLAEAIVGDITPHCGVSAEEKLSREWSAMRQMASGLDEERSHFLLELFNEYCQQATPAAHAAKDLDKLDMCSQALHYQRSRTKQLSEFPRGCLGRVRLPPAACVVSRIVSIMEGSCTKEKEEELKNSDLLTRLLKFAQLKEVTVDKASELLLGNHQYMLALTLLTLPRSCLDNSVRCLRPSQLLSAICSANFTYDPSTGYYCSLSQVSDAFPLPRQHCQSAELLDLLSDLCSLHQLLLPRGQQKQMQLQQIRNPFLQQVQHELKLLQASSAESDCLQVDQQ